MVASHRFRETQNYVRSVNSRLNSLYRNDAGIMSGYVAQSVRPTIQQASVSAMPVSYSIGRSDVGQSNTPSINSNGSGRIYISYGSSQ